MRTFAIALAAALVSAVSAEQVNSDLVIAELNRAIDVSGQVARTTSTFMVENTGSEAQEHVFTLVDASKKLTYVSCEDVESGDQLMVKPASLDGTPAGYTAYKVIFGDGIEAGAKIELLFYTAHIGTMKPLPAEIAQGEPQYVEYFDTVLWMSPYKVTEQSVEVVLASQSPPHFITEKNPSGIENEIATYGPYEDTEPFTFEEMRLHVENNNPFFTVESLTREYEVSHWGNLAVEDQYESLTHTGAKLKGAWSRYEHTRAMNQYTNQDNVIRNIKETIPGKATGIYYRDDIGNISTSAIAETEDGLEFEITPRFPLAGGWKVDFVTGFSLDLADYLTFDSEKYVLNVSFCPAIEHMLAKDYKLKVVLPEGAYDIQVHAPFSVDSHEMKNRFSYLDSKGRPVVVLSKADIIEEHTENIQIEYKFHTIVMLNEPLMIATWVFLVFLSMIVLTRVNLTIGASAVDDGEQAELISRACSLYEKNKSTFEKVVSRAEDGVTEKVLKPVLQTQSKANRDMVMELEEAAKDIEGFNFVPLRSVFEAQGTLFELCTKSIKSKGDDVSEETQDMLESLVRLAHAAFDTFDE